MTLLHNNEYKRGHNLKIIGKCQSVEEAVYYVQNSLDNGWSRSVLTHQIESGLWQRKGKARRMGKGLYPCPSIWRIALEQIRKWYQFWSAASAIAQQPVSQLVQIPWGHNLKIIANCQSVEEAVYYVQSTLDKGWSRSVLTHQIESGLWQREGKARRMGKAIACPSIWRIAIDGHVVPPLPILQGLGAVL